VTGWDATTTADAARRRRFRAVYEADFASVLGYALRRSADPQDAADVVAEAFLIAWRRLDDVPPLGESRLWLYGVARRVLANQRRGERRRDALGRQLMRELALACEDELPSDPKPLARAWAALREADRDILGLAAWEELSGDELATVLGCSRTAAKLRLHRARRRFARELERVGLDWKPMQATGHGQGRGAPALRGTEETW
jgi:RNA polymerase sigma-70 factor (ECF subfamily)